MSFCTLAAAGTRQSCLNGELTKGNTDINTLYLCVSGVWKKLCSSLWGTQQKAVACRQLAQGPLNQLQTTVSGSYSYMYTWNATYSNLVNCAGFFIYNIQCTGQEKALTECRFTKVDTSFCNYIPVKIICEQGYKIYNNYVCIKHYVGLIYIPEVSVTPPMNLTLRAVSLGSIEVNWTQPAVFVSLQYRVSNHSITCTSSHGVHTTTSQHVTTPAVNESTHIHMTVSGLMSNTSYTCCVSAHSELGTSESVCDTVNTTGMSVYACRWILLL